MLASPYCDNRGTATLDQRLKDEKQAVLLAKCHKENQWALSGKYIGQNVALAVLFIIFISYHR